MRETMKEMSYCTCSPPITHTHTHSHINPGFSCFSQHLSPPHSLQLMARRKLKGIRKELCVLVGESHMLTSLPATPVESVRGPTGSRWPTQNRTIWEEFIYRVLTKIGGCVVAWGLPALGPQRANPGKQANPTHLWGPGQQNSWRSSKPHV